MKNQRDPRNWNRWNISGALGGLYPTTARTRDDYDTRSGIEPFLKTLRGFNALIKARCQAGYRRTERLNEWVVFGRFILDACGNAGTITQFPPGFETIDIVPALLSCEAFSLLLMKNGLENSYKWKLENDVPQAGMPCAVCGKTWTIQDCWDCEARSERVVTNLRDFVGRPFRVFRESLRLKTGALYRTTYERDIRNDCFIDLRSNPTYPSLKMNEIGWTRTKTPDGYVIQPGDEIAVDCWRFQHPTCGKEKLAQQIEIEFAKTFERAGYHADILRFTRTPSRYGIGCETWTGPGFSVKTEIGEICIGWRKRIIEIDWSKTGQNLEHLFGDMEVTKGPWGIHAWGYDQAVECLTRVRSALVPTHTS